MNIIIDYSRDKLASQKYHIFSDIAWPFEKDILNRQYKENYDFKAVDVALHNIFIWNPGERILVPEFGNLLHKFITEHINDITSKNIIAGVRKMFEWEPRVKLLNVEVIPVPDENQYNLKIAYAIPVLDKTIETIIRLVSLKKILNPT